MIYAQMYIHIYIYIHMYTYILHMHMYKYTYYTAMFILEASRPSYHPTKTTSNRYNCICHQLLLFAYDVSRIFPSSSLFILNPHGFFPVVHTLLFSSFSRIIYARKGAGVWCALGSKAIISSSFNNPSRIASSATNFNSSLLPAHVGVGRGGGSVPCFSEIFLSLPSFLYAKSNLPY